MIEISWRIYGYRDHREHDLREELNVEQLMGLLMATKVIAWLPRLLAIVIFSDNDEKNRSLNRAIFSHLFLLWALSLIRNEIMP